LRYGRGSSNSICRAWGRITQKNRSASTPGENASYVSWSKRERGSLEARGAGFDGMKVERVA